MVLVITRSMIMNLVFGVFLTLKLKALEWVFGHRRKSKSVYWVHLKTPLTFIKEPVPFM